jgi:hypothetical protein
VKIARVFPRRTNATPDDDLVFFNPPGLFTPEVDEVHVSVTFTWDMKNAEALAKSWETVAPVRIGGPAFGKPSGEFIPGRYVRDGYTITSRGCPNRCWFCSVWKREPELIELEVHDGWNVLDDNLLACSESHIRKVFDMLKRQKHSIDFTGGLEAAILKPWHIDLLTELNPRQMFFAYDTEEDLEPLRVAAKMLSSAGFSKRKMRCYVLIGYPGDKITAAERRLRYVQELGMTPFAMPYRLPSGVVSMEWKRMGRLWQRAEILFAKPVSTPSLW